MTAHIIPTDMNHNVAFQSIVQDIMLLKEWKHIVNVKQPQVDLNYPLLFQSDSFWSPIPIGY